MLVSAVPQCESTIHIHIHMHACMLSHFNCVWFFVTPWTVAHQTSLSMGFSRQDYCSGLCIHIHIHWASSMVQWVKNLPAMQETQKTDIRSLGWEDPLEEEMASLHINEFHSCILVWKIPWTEEPDGLQSMGSQRVRHDWATNYNSFSPYIYPLRLESLSHPHNPSL